MLCPGSNSAQFSLLSVVLNGRNDFCSVQAMTFLLAIRSTHGADGADCFPQMVSVLSSFLNWLCVHPNQTKDSDPGQDLIICQPQSSQRPPASIAFTEAYFLKEKQEGVNFSP